MSAKRLTVELILRHVNHRAQQCAWAIDREEPYHDNDSRREELEELAEWITKRSR